MIPEIHTKRNHGVGLPDAGAYENQKPTGSISDAACGQIAAEKLVSDGVQTQWGFRIADHYLHDQEEHTKQRYVEILSVMLGGDKNV